MSLRARHAHYAWAIRADFHERPGFLGRYAIDKNSTQAGQTALFHTRREARDWLRPRKEKEQRSDWHGYYCLCSAVRVRVIVEESVIKLREEP